MKDRSLVGIWTIESCSLSLGGLITFIQELTCRGALEQIENIDLCILDAAGDARNLLLNSTLPPKDGETLLLQQTDGLVGAARGFRMIRNFLYATSPDAVTGFYAGSHVSFWPDFGDKRTNYGTTLNLKGLISPSDLGAAPLFKPSVTSLARTIVEAAAGRLIPVAVNLKSNPASPGSHAIKDVWLNFLTRQAASPRHKFILVGNDEVDSRILDLENVAKPAGTLGQDLAVISECAFFLGMANGPANIPVFTAMPYLIIKHPDHHVEEMAVELGALNKVWFARDNQQIERVYETVELLEATLEKFTRIVT